MDNRQTDRQTDSQTDRHTDRQTDKEMDNRQTHNPTTDCLTHLPEYLHGLSSVQWLFLAFSVTIYSLRCKKDDCLETVLKGISGGESLVSRAGLGFCHGKKYFCQDSGKKTVKSGGKTGKNCNIQNCTETPQLG